MARSDGLRLANPPHAPEALPIPLGKSESASLSTAIKVPWNMVNAVLTRCARSATSPEPPAKPSCFPPLRSAAGRRRQTEAWAAASRPGDRSRSVAHATSPNLVELLKRLFVSRMSEEAMSGPAKTLSPSACRWILIAASVVTLLGSAAAPARAGDFDAPYRYDDGPARYDYDHDRYDPYRYRYDPYRYHPSSVRPSGVIERRSRYIERKYVEREYVERRYTWPVRRYHSYGCCNTSRYAYPRYRTWSAPFPWGYGGIRGQRPSYAYGRSAYYAPRPPAPVGYDAGPYGDDEGRRWDPE